LSLINGPLSLTAANGAPNFYFINPAGVTFSAGASINVPGAFHVSTANYLKFPDGNLYIDTTVASTFSSAEPAAFGFLGATRSSILVKDAVLYNPAGGMTLAASDVQIDHATLETAGGDISIVASGAGVLQASRSGTLPASGRLEMINGSQVWSSATALSDGGNIRISAGDTGIRSGSLVGTFASAVQRAGGITADLGSLEIDGRSASGQTGITSQAAFEGLGAGGPVVISARDAIQILGGGMITSDTYGVGHAGNVTVKATSLQLDGAEHLDTARITSRSGLGAVGNAGVVTVDVADAIVLSNASLITSDSFGLGQAGNISLRSGREIQVLSDSFVASNAYATGDAGAIEIATQYLTIDGTGGKLLTQVSSQAFSGSQGNAGTIHMTASGALSVINGGRVNTSTFGSGNAGEILVTTGTLLLDGRNYAGSTGIFSTADASLDKNDAIVFSSGNGGTVNIHVAGDAQILGYASVSSDTWSQGRGGDVIFKANNLLIDGMGTPYGAGAGISSEATGYGSTVAGLSGHGGSVVVDVPGHLQVAGLGYISTSTLTQGSAGPVSVTVGLLTIDGQNANIQSRTYSGSTGDGGLVFVKVADNATITNGGDITAITAGSGHAGNIDMQVTGSLNIGGGARIESGSTGSGDAGNIDITAGKVLLARGVMEDYAWILSDSFGSGIAGSIHVTATNSIELAEGGFITSDAWATGHAGAVSVSAPDIQIGGFGLLKGAAISSDTYGSGNAGRVEVNAQTVTIEGGKTRYPTGIASHSLEGSSGNAGTVVVNVGGALQVLGGGVVTSGVEGSGRGGEVQVKAGSIEVSGDGSQIGAAAMATSSGQPGNVSVHADGTLVLASGGNLSIQNEGNNAQPSSVLPSLLSVEAAQLSLIDAGTIKANATGNVAAGALQISVGDRVSLKNSSITTSANSGNGGPISIQAGSLVELNHSQITTSVLGQSGNGGNIHAGASALVMNTGFIQANTAAHDAAGGNVAIDVQTLLTSGNTLFLGGQTAHDFLSDIFGFNVIQAAAPTGVSGTVNVTAPVLDIAGSLSSLGGTMIDSGRLGRNPCQTTDGSSLSVAGRGGVAPSARGWLGTQLAPPPIASGGAGVKITTGDLAAKVLTCRSL
jgi:large exoprotein involved in heme utilization and adhesion